ncbi:hypothetical protein WDZ17_09260 [Pseudokineococcus basanitobsidens]|uniref:DUF4430 domain-containing protein n=1 Tax=Pseudokineococcus basanitobsidens TaxID=1926649 RepID=A0ABU8RKE0_9ACTN
MPARPRPVLRHRWAALVAGAGLAVALGVGPAAATPATPTPATPTPAPGSSAPADVAPTGEACPEGEGATVVVDPQGLAGELDGPTAGCAPAAEDGLAALTDAGFAVTEVSPGFVCTIAGVPTPEEADCETAGYWSYWYAPRDGAWTLSDVGAADRTPEPGSVDAWSWTVLSGDSLDATPPRLQPAAVADLPVAGAEGTTSPSATDEPSPSASASPSVGGGSVDDGAQDAAGDIEEDGPPVGTIAVVAVLVVLVVVGGLLAARRRRADLDEHGRGASDGR